MKFLISNRYWHMSELRIFSRGIKGVLFFRELSLLLPILECVDLFVDTCVKLNERAEYESSSWKCECSHCFWLRTYVSEILLRQFLDLWKVVLLIFQILQWIYYGLIWKQLFRLILFFLFMKEKRTHLRLTTPFHCFSFNKCF